MGQAACNRGNTRYFAMVSRCIALQFCLFASGGMWHYNLLVFNMGWMAQFQKNIFSYVLFKFLYGVLQYCTQTAQFIPVVLFLWIICLLLEKGACFFSLKISVCFALTN